MYKIIAVSIALYVLALPLFAQKKYETYSNARFAFSVDYPGDLLEMQEEAMTGDGRVFLSSDKEVEMRVWASYNVFFHSIEEEAKWSIENLKGFEISYKKLGNSWFVLSGTSGPKIVYQKTLYHKFEKTDVFYTLKIEYPASQKRKLDAVIKRIEKSFRFDPKGDV